MLDEKMFFQLYFCLPNPKLIRKKALHTKLKCTPACIKVPCKASTWYLSYVQVCYGIQIQIITSGSGIFNFHLNICTQMKTKTNLYSSKNNIVLEVSHLTWSGDEGDIPGTSEVTWTKNAGFLKPKGSEVHSEVKWFAYWSIKESELISDRLISDN